jgi:hypothetical protein
MTTHSSNAKNMSLDSRLTSFTLSGILILSNQTLHAHHDGFLLEAMAAHETTLFLYEKGAHIFCVIKMIFGDVDSTLTGQYRQACKHHRRHLRLTQIGRLT